MNSRDMIIIYIQNNNNIHSDFSEAGWKLSRQKFPLKLHMLLYAKRTQRQNQNI